MFSDLFERLRVRIRTVVKPAMQNLFSAKRNFINIFIAVLLLETMLGVLLLSLSSNLATEAALAEELAGFSDMAEHGSASSAAVEMISSRVEEIRQKNMAVFVFSMLAWLAVSAFITLKMFSSTVELNKYTYGLYITFGADTKKIRKMIFWQILLLGTLALVIALPASALICLAIYGFLSGEFVMSLTGVLAVSLAIFALLFGVITVISRKTVSQTPVSLLASADVSGYVRSPRRSSRHVFAERPFSIAAMSVLRMRGYYITLVISAVLPVCLFFCCMSMATANESRARGDIQQFTLSFEEGFDPTEYPNVYKEQLEKIDGVTGSSINGGGKASTFGTNMIFDSGVLKNEAFVTKAFSGVAYDDIYVVCCDNFSLKSINIYISPKDDPNKETLGPYGLSTTPEKGSFILLYPKTEPGSETKKYTPRYVPDENEIVFFSLNTEIHGGTTLAERVNKKRIGFTLKNGESREINNYYKPVGKTYEYAGPRLTDEYILLNASDYSLLTGIDAAENAENGKASPIFKLSELGSFIITKPGSVMSSDKTVTANGVSAVNDFFISVGDEYSAERFLLPNGTELPESSGEVTLVLHSGSRIPSDIASIRIAESNSVETSFEEGLNSTDSDRLRQLLKASPQRYREFKVKNVVASETAEQDTILFLPSDFTALCGHKSAYDEIYINVDGSLGIKDIFALTLRIYSWGENVYPGAPPKIADSDKLWDALLTESCRYNEIIRVLAFLLLLSVPFIWFYPQYNHYKKRRSDLTVLTAIGRPMSDIFRIMLAEGVFAAMLGAVFSLILCPVFTTVFYGFSSLVGLPFATEGFDFVSLAVAILFTAFCSVLTSLLNYLLMFGAKKSKPEKITCRRKYNADIINKRRNKTI